MHDESSPAVSLVARENSRGSGIVAAANGFILTSAHVVEHATSVQATIYERPD